jgi:hypothetical protein
MFVHISPEPEALGETISTLKFAERVSTIELGAARANKESGEVKELKEQVLTSYLFFILGISYLIFCGINCEFLYLQITNFCC